MLPDGPLLLKTNPSQEQKHKHCVTHLSVWIHPWPDIQLWSQRRPLEPVAGVGVGQSGPRVPPHDPHGRTNGAPGIPGRAEGGVLAGTYEDEPSPRLGTARQVAGGSGFWVVWVGGDGGGRGRWTGEAA